MYVVTIPTDRVEASEIRERCRDEKIENGGKRGLRPGWVCRLKHPVVVRYADKELIRGPRIKCVRLQDLRLPSGIVIVAVEDRADGIVRLGIEAALFL